MKRKRVRTITTVIFGTHNRRGTRKGIRTDCADLLDRFLEWSLSKDKVWFPLSKLFFSFSFVGDWF